MLYVVNIADSGEREERDGNEVQQTPPCHHYFREFREKYGSVAGGVDDPALKSDRMLISTF